MSDEAKTTDHALSIRLAKLCGMPTQWTGEYPCVLESPARKGLWLVTGFNDPQELWNPLEDDRQCFRYVVAALGRLGATLELCVPCQGWGPVFATFACKQLARPHIWATAVGETVPGRNVARPICLAALEAAEKLEERGYGSR